MPWGAPTPAGGGGSAAPTARGIFTALTGAGIAIANGATALLDWNATQITNNVFDLTDPFHPVVLHAGIHCVTVEVGPFADMTVGGFFQLLLTFAEAGDAARTQEDSRIATAAQGSPDALTTNTFYVPAGDSVSIIVRNRDGAASRNFGINIATVQRIT